MGRIVSGVRGPSDTVPAHKRPGARLAREPELAFRSGLAREPRLVGGSVSGSDTAGTVSRALPGDLTAVREARTVVQQVLDTWQADEIFDDVVLVASELVANALRHGLRVEQASMRMSMIPDCSAIGPEGVRISLVSTGRHVICAVTDPSEEPPIRRTADLMAGSGRGLQLVESLSLCWGWTVLDGDADGSSAGAVQGKSVWAIFPLELSPDDRRQGQVMGAA